MVDDDCRDDSRVAYPMADACPRCGGHGRGIRSRHGSSARPKQMVCVPCAAAFGIVWRRPAAASAPATAAPRSAA